MKTQLVENLKLLDGMHEGLLILSKSDNKAMFCNRPAHKLLSGAIESHGGVERATNSDNSKILTPDIFYPVKVDVKDRIKNFIQIVDGQKKEAPMSLD